MTEPTINEPTIKEPTINEPTINEPTINEPVFPVEASHVLMFARAIHDQSPVHRSREAAMSRGLAGIPAPLTFVQAGAQFDPDYPLRPRPDEAWFGSGGDAGFVNERLTSLLHAEQHFEYHRPIVVGDTLTWQTRDGETWTKTSRSGAQLTFHELVTEFRDAEGRLVVTARAVTVDTGAKGEPR